MKKLTWMWDFTDICFNPDRYVRFMYEKGITDLYLQFSMSAMFDNSMYKPLVKQLSQKGIRVHATNGASSWVFNPQHLERFLDSVHLYNTTCDIDEMFYGIHFDIEPYSLPEWKIDKENMTLHWENLIKTYVERSRLPVSAALPFWFHTLGDSFVQTVLNNHDHIALMSYRNVVEGPNSLSSIVQPTLDLVSYYKSYADIVVGMETISVTEGAHISYYDKTSRDLIVDMRNIFRKYDQVPYVTGVAVHSLSGWIALENRK